MLSDGGGGVNRLRRLYQLDNLDVLRGLDSGIIDLIATDPPFNKGRDFHATPDSLAKGASFSDRWSWDDAREEWQDTIKDDWPSVWSAIECARTTWGDGMAGFMVFMVVRLIECHRVLKKTGSMYLHCDPTASHYLKVLMDAVFGKDNFRNEFVWKRTNVRGAGAKKVRATHDLILHYAASSDTTFNRVLIPHDQIYVDKFYKRVDKHGPYRSMSLVAAGTRSGHSGKPWRGMSPNSGNHWSCPGTFPDHVSKPANWDDMTTQQKLDCFDTNGLILWPKKTGGVPQFKRYLSGGQYMTDMITDVAPMSAKSDEYVNYPTQKPLALYGRFIKASSNPGDLVLDPFAGCATTCVAAEKLGRSWIGIDIWEGTKRVTAERLTREGILEIDGERRGDILTSKGVIEFSMEPPIRTDDTDETMLPGDPTPQVTSREPPGPKMSRAEMVCILMEECKGKCMGCGRTFDDPRYLELDHNVPRADRGINHISNRVLLCSPCNRLKSHKYTLSGLQLENKRLGYMVLDN